MAHVSDEPLVTIGVPTFNRTWSLPQVLDAILAFDYPRKAIRLCFIDNQSTDGTLNSLEAFRREHVEEYEDIRIRVVKSSIPRARNEIFREAAGSDYVFFLDSDIIAPKDTIDRLLENFKGNPAVGMASIPWDNRNAKRRAGVLYDAFTAPPGPHSAYKVGNGCNIVSMKAVNDVGPFNEKLLVHEDGEFCYRLRKKGYKIMCDFSSQGTHLREYNLGWKYYLNFMKDSARTYRELMLRGSLLHIAKVVLSVAALVSFFGLLIFPTLLSSFLFIGIVLSAVFLNSSARVLDDGIHVRARYRLLVGFVFTMTTLCISAFLIYGSILRKR